MIGVIDVGGGLRGIFGAGVFDYCLDKGLHFDYGIGVSAGAANIVSYQAKQRGRNYRFYTIYNLRKEAMSAANFLKTRSYLDLEYIYGELTREGMEDPLDFRALQAEPAPFKIVATNALTGEPFYFSKEDLSGDNYSPISASSCVPVVCRPVVIGGIPFYDGGASDPIPYKKAFSDGCDRIAVVLTRPRDQYRTPGKDERFAKILKLEYPEAARALAKRSVVYNNQLDAVKALEKEGKAIILAPDDIHGMKTLTKDIEAMKMMYRSGFKEAEKLLDFM